jgi:oxygen-independent coproporphyrinogen-3 oxidase
LEEKLPNEIEVLRNGSLIMSMWTGLRTIWGVSLDRIEAEFGQMYSDYLHKQAQKFIDDKLLL